MKRTRDSSIVQIKDSGVFTLALIGDSPCGVLLSGVFARTEFTETFPWVKLVGIVAGAGERPAAWVTESGWPVFAGCDELFAAYPDLDMVCDLTDDSRYMETLRARAPHGCSLISGTCVRLFCETVTNGGILIGGGARLRAARNVLESLMNQVDQDILILDDSGKVLDCNQHFLDTWGGDKTDYIGRRCDDLGLGSGNPGSPSACPYKQVLESGEKYFAEFGEVTPDNTMRHYRVLAFPVVRDEARLKRVVLMRSDITAKVQMEQRLQQTEKMAAVGELSTYIAHEIRNPLFAIGGFANSLLRSPSLDQAARDKVRIILDESKRLDEILRSIVNFARPTDQKVAEVDVNEVAEQTVELMGIGAEERHMVLQQDLAATLPKVRGNAEMIKQCLINIIKNAQEALSDSGGTVTVRSFLKNSRVLLEVEDTGRGIPPELHEQIFSPFFSTKDKGSGLGLAMTRKIIGELGGKVHLRSQEGKGTTISMEFLPVLSVHKQ